MRVSLAVLLVGGLFSASAHGQNVLLIIADDAGVDKIGIYQKGTDPPRTPNIDQLARNGVLFRHAWSNPLCAPSRGRLHTGMHAFRTGGDNLSPEQTTLAQVMRAAGHDCGLVGKWGFSNLDGGLLDRGWIGPSLYGWGHYTGCLTPQLPDFYQWDRTTNGATKTTTKYATTVTVNDALRWINHHKDAPWMCWVAFNAPHEPFHAPPTRLHQVRLPNVSPDINPVPFYNAMLEAMDTEMGRLLASLGDELRETVVIFISDNGTFGPVTLPPIDPLRAKGTVYEAGVNVPLIISGPLVVDPGREVTALVHLVDLFATIADIGDASAKSAIDSVSLVPYLVNPAQSSLRTTVYTEIDMTVTLDTKQPIRSGRDRTDDAQAGIPLAQLVGNRQQAIRNARYKLVVNSRAREEAYHELFDLQDDPFEHIDLLAGSLSPEQQTNYDMLLSELERLTGDVP